MASWILGCRLVCMISLMSKDSEISLHNISSAGLLMNFFQCILHHWGVTCILWIFNETPPSVWLREALYIPIFAPLPLLIWFTSHLMLLHLLDFTGGPLVRNPPANAGDMGFDPGPGKIPRALEQLGPSPRTQEPVLCNKRRHPSKKPVNHSWRVAASHCN